MRSSLTKYFGSYNIAKYEKATGKGVMDLLDIGNFEINRIATLIKLGNRIDNEEEIYKILDDYLREDEEHSLISAYFDLLDDLDHDLRILKSCGVNVNDLKDQFKNMAEDRASRLLNDNNKDIENKSIEDSETKDENKVINLSTPEMNQE